MSELSAKRSNIVEKLLQGANPQHEPEVLDAMAAFQEARARSRDAVMLDLRMGDGTIESFSYAYLTRVRFVPGDSIALRFGRDEVRLVGRNLGRLCETITEHRTRFIQEGPEGADGLKAADAAHVEQIVITEEEEL